MGVGPTLWSWWCYLVRCSLCLGRATGWSRGTRGSSEVALVFSAFSVLALGRSSPGTLADEGNLRKETSKKGGTGPPDSASE